MGGGHRILYGDIDGSRLAIIVEAKLWVHGGSLHYLLSWNMFDIFCN